MRVRLCSLAAATSLTLSACAMPSSQLDVLSLRDATSVEMQTDLAGRLTEIEYQISPSDVPEPVRAAMDRLYPGEAFDGAELELHGRQVLYELSRPMDGFKLEALFLPDGTLVDVELEIPAEAAPADVRQSVTQRFPRATATSFEEILDGQQRVTEYHVKVTQDAYHYKLALYVNGLIRAIWREVPAEVEVPLEG